MSLKVFLSYAIKDADFAQSVKARIKEILPQYKAENIDIFDVRTDLALGESIRESIKSAISSANTVVIVSSESSDLSPSVNYEIGLADALGKELVIVEKEGAEGSELHRRFLEIARIIKVENG